jgi:hypothetical protein
MEPAVNLHHMVSGINKHKQITNAPSMDTKSSLFCVTEQERIAVTMFQIPYKKTRFIRKKDSI